jgi:hypothetical protein
VTTTGVESSEMAVSTVTFGDYLYGPSVNVKVLSLLALQGPKFTIALKLRVSLSKTTTYGS